MKLLALARAQVWTTDAFAAMPAPTTTEDVWVPSGGAFIEGELVHTSAEEPAPAVRRADGEPFDGDAPSAAECLPRAALPPGGYEDNTQVRRRACGGGANCDPRTRAQPL